MFGGNDKAVARCGRRSHHPRVDDANAIDRAEERKRPEGKEAVAVVAARQNASRRLVTADVRLTFVGHFVRTTDMKLGFPICVIALVSLSAAILAAEPPAPWQGLNTVVNLLAKFDDPAAQSDVLRGVSDALKGRRQVPMPQGWRAIYAKLQASSNAEVRDQSAALALTFGDADAIAALRHKAANAKADPADRLKAIDALAAAHDNETGKILLTLLDDAPIRATAIRDLAGYSESATPGAILDRYRKLNDVERRDAVNTLASRAAWAVPLLDAVEKGSIPHARRVGLHGPSTRRLARSRHRRTAQEVLRQRASAGQG